MSVYKGEEPEFLRASLESLCAQTRPADEVVIVLDGQLTEELLKVISHYCERLPVSMVPLEKNMGLGPALCHGVKECRYDVIARMDSDDICISERFRMQLEFLEAHPEIDALGGSIREFAQDPSKCITERRMPLTHEAILARGASRNPMNHMTVVFRKSAVLQAGNYRSLRGLEDYDLWIRMLRKGSRFHNLPQVLVLVRAGSGMLSRRGGLDYLCKEAELFHGFWKMGFIGFWRFIGNILARVPARLLPLQFRRVLYSRFLRTKRKYSE